MGPKGALGKRTHVFAVAADVAGRPLRKSMAKPYLAGRCFVPLEAHGAADLPKYQMIRARGPQALPVYLGYSGGFIHKHVIFQ